MFFRWYFYQSSTRYSTLPVNTYHYLTNIQHTPDTPHLAPGWLVGSLGKPRLFQSPSSLTWRLASYQATIAELGNINGLQTGGNIWISKIFAHCDCQLKSWFSLFVFKYRYHGSTTKCSWLNCSLLFQSFQFISFPANDSLQQREFTRSRLSSIFI